MSRRELVMLAQTYDPGKAAHKISDSYPWYASEKMDGMRAFWDGGMTAGKWCKDVSWANTKKDRVPRRSTGLWSRQGKPINAPIWFLARLPAYPLDGELWAGRGRFQQTMSTCRKLVPVDAEWRKITYMVFDMPSLASFRSYSGTLPWGKAVNAKEQYYECSSRQFKTIARTFKDWEADKILHPVQQTIIRSTNGLEMFMEHVLSLGGEGVILRSPDSVWVPKRVPGMLKYKPFHDAEAVVTGYAWGRETDKGSKLLGKMGAMIVRWKDKEFELGTGFDDSERILINRSDRVPDVACKTQGYRCEAVDFAGRKVGAVWSSRLFPRGSKVTFRYRELSDSGIPKDARFLRKYEV